MDRSPGSSRSGRWPVSFLTLAWTGLLLVTIPLGVGLVGAGWWADHLARVAARSLEQSSVQGVWSRQLADKLLTLERKARQLVVLGDRELLEDYRSRREELADILGRLERELGRAEDRPRVERIRRIESVVFSRLVAGPLLPGELGGALARFGEAHALARRLGETLHRMVQERARRMRREAGRLRGRLAWLAAAGVPLTLGIAALFAHVLARPVRSLEQEIVRLGQGRFENRVEIRGPRDLVALGERLDWMRCRLQELESEKTRFLAHLSHDLKTPLTAIREGADLLLGGVAGDLAPEQEEVARIVRENSLQLQRQIENLLAFSMGEPRDAREPGEALDLASLVRDVLDDIQPASLSRGLTVDLRGETVRVRGPRRRLRSLVENLVSNAVKFTPDGGRVRVRVRREGDHAVLEVMDSGPGVDPGERERVFEAFYQGRAKGRGPVKGSGLGLAIVREYAQAHGGRVELCDSDLGGAGFRVVLPADEDRPT
ncbi:sensor histidine kinase [Deferrisoma camini]|uniref:sensor histidine kinase n=1 Tax=Deferrisoma camini TaxID=1035120 RepID=UPI00046CDBC8|nr:HAMP domain-containing sensor histidine kinase [Deferrisoma camini]